MNKNLLLLVSLLAACLVTPVLAQTKEPPVPVRTVAPDYPSELRSEGISGLVTIQCTINEKGEVVEPRIEKSSNAAFEQPALAAIKKWKFKPAKIDGVPSATRVSLPIKFVFEN